MSIESVQIHNKGKTFRVPSVTICDRTVIATGRWIKIATVRDEDLVEGEVASDPPTFVSNLKRSKLKGDIFTFRQRIDEAQPKYDYLMEWDNVAVAVTENFDKWWEKLPQEARKNTRRAAKRGVSVQLVEFNDEFVNQIKSIYDETPVRQGMRFWHFGKDFETVKKENATYPERSEFIGAYFGEELIGFIKLIYADRAAHIIQILSKVSHYDKRPMNALIAKAVEVCQKKGILYLIYSKFTFGNKKGSQLTEFKRRNGFEKVLFPRYYVPLTWKGRVALKLKLHRGLLGILPPKLISLLWQLRAWLLNVGMRKLKHGHAGTPLPAEEAPKGPAISVSSSE